jgi:hypothetical protein
MCRCLKHPTFLVKTYLPVEVKVRDEQLNKKFLLGCWLKDPVLKGNENLSPLSLSVPTGWDQSANESNDHCSMEDGLTSHQESHPL